MTENLGDGGARGVKHWLIALWSGALALWLLPLVAMRFDDSVVNWSASDFVVFGALLLEVCLGLELALGLTSRRARLAACLAAVPGFLWLWEALAVCLFTACGRVAVLPRPRVGDSYSRSTIATD